MNINKNQNISYVQSEVVEIPQQFNKNMVNTNRNFRRGISHQNIPYQQSEVIEIPQQFNKNMDNINRNFERGISQNIPQSNYNFTNNEGFSNSKRNHIPQYKNIVNNEQYINQKQQNNINSQQLNDVNLSNNKMKINNNSKGSQQMNSSGGMLNPIFKIVNANYVHQNSQMTSNNINIGQNENNSSQKIQNNFNLNQNYQSNLVQYQSKNSADAISLSNKAINNNQKFILPPNGKEELFDTDLTIKELESNDNIFETKFLPIPLDSKK
jgi:hypothetical protein